MSEKASIQQYYREYVEQMGKRPKWLFRFLEATQLQQEQFDNHYQTLADLEIDIWDDVAQQVLSVLQQDSEYPAYSSAEKLLAYYFTLLQTLSEHQTTFEGMIGSSRTWGVLPQYLRQFRDHYLDYIASLVEEGIEEGSIASRFTLSNYYKRGLWWQCLFILNYWSNDDSTDKSASDEAVERAVVLSFELMGHNAVDSAIGLGKFLLNKTRT